MRALRLVPFVALVCSLAAPVRASTPEAARQLLQRALSYVEQVGEEKAFHDFQDKEKGFVVNDLYVLVYALDGTCLSHGQFPAWVGTNRLDALDVEGKRYMHDMVMLSIREGAGMIDYVMRNPATGQDATKVTYFRRPAGKKYLVAVGAYR